VSQASTSSVVPVRLSTPARERRRREQRAPRRRQRSPIALRQEAVDRKRADVFDRRVCQIGEERAEVGRLSSA
jgi:hypothetical protein